MQVNDERTAPSQAAAPSNSRAWAVGWIVLGALAAALMFGALYLGPASAPIPTAPVPGTAEGINEDPISDRAARRP